MKQNTKTNIRVVAQGGRFYLSLRGTLLKEISQAEVVANRQRIIRNSGQRLPNIQKSTKNPKLPKDLSTQVTEEK